MAGQCPMCESDAVRSIAERTYQERRWTLSRCRACGLHFTSPPPTEEDIASFYTGTFHHLLQTEGATEAVFGSKFRRYAQTLGRHLHAGRVVDVGCSTGLLVRVLRDRGYDAEGVELNPQSAAWGRRHYGVQIHATPLEQCAYAPASLDALLMTDVLEHMRHPRDYLRQAGRLLKPGGVALVTFPDIRSAESRYQLLWSRWLGRDWIWEFRQIPLHVWEFTRPTAEACFASAGFRVAEFRRYQPRPDNSERPLSLRLLNLPLRPLHWPGLRRLFGTQMEFVIRKTE